MFDTLSMERLKLSAVVISLFHGPFSAPTAAKVLGVVGAPYLEAKCRFYELFMSRMEKIAKLMEPDYVRAFHLFETDRVNYELTIEISLQPDNFSLPGDIHENALISSLFIAMLDDKQLIKVFHCWANMCKDDGRSSKHFFLVFHDSL